MDRLDAMAMAVAAIDEGSLAAAARRFGRSAAAATRAIAVLEAAAGETLLLRSTRGLRLTEAGARHAAVWRDVLGKLRDIQAEQTGTTISGHLVLTAPELFGRLKVTPVLESFVDLHPEVQARALLLNQVVDMLGEGVDIAIRLAHLPESSLVAVKLGTVRQVICASPAYLAKHGQPQQPADLSRHVCIGTNPEGNRELWNLRHDPSGARMRSISVQTRLSINSVAAGLDAARRGAGLVRGMSYQVADDLATGRLLRVLAPFEPDAIPVNMVFRPHPRRWSPVRGFVDYAVPILRRELAQVAAVVDWLPPAGAPLLPSSDPG
ncbi:LysR family transcriptional regulator [Acidisoma silvae]|uniref:LysR family transcriptional regulator n=1 Tax=Acidisoma silvae TaxID=2802396 RepID=A0A964E1A2_9PROT|nr:LysR family transcriptional regulator [Acidisoma silvae]MCB8877578.1 LysR family transcriptional regulator [Acidisoma silvae]